MTMQTSVDRFHRREAVGGNPEIAFDNNSYGELIQ
jgi:hypothetical protein